MADKEKKSQNNSLANNAQYGVGVRDSLVVPATTEERSGAKKKVSKKPIYIVMGILLVVVAGWAVLGGNIPLGQKVYAEVNGHKIYKKDIDAIREGRKNISDHEAATLLADKYLGEILGKENKVAITDQDMIDQYGPDVTGKKSDVFAWQTMWNEALFSKLDTTNQGVYKGKLLVAHFSRWVAIDSPSLDDKMAVQPKLGNQAAIDADKKYAGDFINELYEKLKSRQITWDQAIETEHTDPVVGEAAYSTLTHSRSFNGPLSDASILSASDVRPKVEALKPGELMKPMVVTTNVSPRNNDRAGVYWLMVQLDSRQPGADNGENFRDYITAAKKRLGYKVNV